MTTKKKSAIVKMPRVLLPDEVKEQGVLVKKDLIDLIAVLRYCLGSGKQQYVSNARLMAIADKFEIQLNKFR